MSRSLARITAIRHISLVKPNASSIVPAQLAQKLDVEPVFGSENESTESRFKTLGTPATLCSVSLPASVPLYVRRGCLVSLHNTQDLHIEHKWVDVMWSLIKYGSWRPALFHKLISPTPFNALVAPNVGHSRLTSWFGFSSQPFRTLCLLTLDGTQDWYVFGKNGLIGYEGNTSLDIRTSGIIRSRSSPLPGDYRVLQGRGNALLSGAGSVYTIQLSDDSDELILKSEHLLAISSKNDLDLKNSTSEYRLGALPTQQHEQTATNKVSSTPTTVEKTQRPEPEPFNIQKLGQLISTAGVNSWNWTKRAYTAWANGRTKYLKIRGPRTLLVQSSHNAFMPATQYSPKQPVSSDHKIESSKPAVNKKDYLSYVTVNPNGKVDFQSTGNFDSRVAEIESSKRK
ncbi:LAFA_0D04434g1_1 [Lachancea sp. 'fantastica']|nr:LAFA_0D04434g1_1 [Lachancea sp. 'fantastica']